MISITREGDISVSVRAALHPAVEQSTRRDGLNPSLRREGLSTWDGSNPSPGGTQQQEAPVAGAPVLTTTLSSKGMLLPQPVNKP